MHDGQPATTSSSTSEAPDFCTSGECISDGHPDKLCDQIADAVLDACLERDPNSRVAIEVAFKGHDVLLLGELTTQAELDYEAIVREVLTSVGHTDGRWGLCPDRVRVRTRLTRQAPEIAKAIARTNGQTGAGDQAIVTGFACQESPALMPLAYALARALVVQHRKARFGEARSILGPDAKALVVVHVGPDGPTVSTLVLSSQHAKDASHEMVEEALVDLVIKPVVPREFVTAATTFLLNPGGSFIEGGPLADAGLTGRKIVADSYGPEVPHGGGALSGKDGTKIDRAGAYAARWAAKALVASGLMGRALIRVAYAIGIPEPVLLELIPGRHDPALTDAAWARLRPWLWRELAPGRIVESLGLRRPLFRPFAAFGHFGRRDVEAPWEVVPELGNPCPSHANLPN